MQDPRIEKLQSEVSIGDKYQRTWDDLVQPFFDAKQAELFDAFKDVVTGGVDNLDNIHRQSKVLESLRNEFTHHINTGKLASSQLQEDTDGN